MDSVVSALAIGLRRKRVRGAIVSKRRPRRGKAGKSGQRVWLSRHVNRDVCVEKKLVCALCERGDNRSREVQDSSRFCRHSSGAKLRCRQQVVHSKQYTVHSTQYTVSSTQYTVHSAQCTVNVGGDEAVWSGRERVVRQKARRR